MTDAIAAPTPGGGRRFRNDGHGAAGGRESGGGEGGGGEDDGDTGRADAPGGTGGGIAPLEWLAAALGGLIVLAVLIFLLWEGMGGGDGPPEVSVSATRVTVQSDGFHVGFVARNDGASPAMALAVEAVLTTPEGAEERLETVLDYLPARSSRRGGFVFADDPRLGRLELRAASYQEP